MAFISIIVPCFNEELALPIFMKALAKVKFSPATRVELDFVDDGSSDHTLKIIKQIAAKRPDTHYISFSRNFGKESGILAGLRMAHGDYITVMDVDLQDPPELLPKMIKLLDENPDLDVVDTRRQDRTGDREFTSWLSTEFYKIANKLMTVSIPVNARDFRLMRRKVAQTIIDLPENNRFIKGLFSWVGYKQTLISYPNHQRSSGTSHFSTWTLFKYAFSGLMDFSKVFINLPFIFALFTLTGLIISLFLPARTILVAVFFCSTLFLTSIGIVTHYLWNIYMQVKKRPMYIVREQN